MKTLTSFVLCFICLVSFAQSPDKNPDQPEVVFVKGGTFEMGGTDFEREMPIHTVTVSDFSIGKYEVTVGDYRKFCDETSTEMPDEPGWGWEEDHPVVNVDWKDAVAYCEWLGTKYGGTWRLPTEAEWEYAARGGNKSQDTEYSGGNDLESLAWFGENSEVHTHPVGLKKPNELGIYDMSGNAREWCKDFYNSKYYESSASVDPQGPETGGYHTSRGGSWYTKAFHCRVSDRSIRLMHGHPDYSLGFRVAFSE